MSHMLIINFLCIQDQNVRFVNKLNEAISHLVIVGFDIVRYLAYGLLISYKHKNSKKQKVFYAFFLNIFFKILLWLTLLPSL